MHLNGDNAYKIMLGNSIEDYSKLLRIKAQLGERFYVRNIDNKLERGFVVGFFKDEIRLLDADLQSLVEPMCDEGVERLCVAELFRFLPEPFITDFVKKGEIWLSTFKRCQRLEDEARVDGNEGKVAFYYAGDKVANAHIGTNAYMLCGSLSPFASGSMPYGKCICIQDVSGLVKAINKALRSKGIGVSAVLQGPCIYTDHRVCLEGNPERTPAELEKILTVFGDRVYFLKDALPHFMLEHEYRVVWLTDGETTEEGVLVQIDNPELYVRAISIPQYTQMFRPPTVAAKNCPYVIPPQMVAPPMMGKVRVV